MLNSKRILIGSYLFCIRRRRIDYVIVGKHLVLYMTNTIDSMLPCACLVTDHRRRQNVVRNVIFSSAARVPLFGISTC